MTYDTLKKAETAVLVGVDRGADIININASLDELEELAKTAGAAVCGRLTQKRDKPDNAYFLGKGKLEELQDLVGFTGANLIIFDDELSPAQLRNLSKRFDTKIIDRTLLILDIFASRANSAEGAVQVELAQLKYKLSHLSGLGVSLSRLAGGIGTRGPGEAKLESDRRYIRERINALNNELKAIEKQRRVLRTSRVRDGIPVISAVGYTNAGKSTVMNLLTDAGVLAEDKLFATLDTTTRRVQLPGGSEFLFTDTVGFIQKLPHQLIKAFRATLEELNYADALVHVVDASNPMRQEQMETVYNTLTSLNCFDKPIITIFNKTDLFVEMPLPNDKNAVKTCTLSAKTGEGKDALLEAIEAVIRSFKKKLAVLIPYAEGSMLNLIHHNCEIVSEEHKENGTALEIYANNEMEKRLEKFVT